MALSDEDRQWIRGELQGLEASIRSGMRLAIESVETDLSAKIVRVETDLSAKIVRVETDLSAKIEHVETSLLTAFHKWASPLEARQRTHAAAIRALDEEMEYLQDRVKKLEDDRPAA